MTTLGDPFPFIPRATLDRLGSELSTIGTVDRPISFISSAAGTFTNVNVTLINGLAFPPPASGDFVDNVTAIIDAVDPTIRITFDAAGTPGTDARIVANQAVNRQYTFDEPGADTQVLLSEGAQTIVGAKTFTNLSVVDNVDPTIGFSILPDGTAGTLSTLRFNNATSRVYSLPDPGANTDIVTAQGTQTIGGIKTIADTSLVIQNSGDPTIQFAIDAAGAAGTTAILSVQQSANNTYAFPDPGVDTTVLLSEGAQTIIGAKTFQDNGFTIFNGADPAAQITLQLDGAIGTTSSFVTTQSTSATFVYIEPVGGASDVLLTEGNQTVISPIEFVGGINTDLVTNVTPNFGTEVEGVRVFGNTTTVTFVQILPNTAPADISILLAPKGNGAISTTEPDQSGTTVARGDHSLDFQRSLNADWVAGGTACALFATTTSSIDTTASYSGVIGATFGFITGTSTNSAVFCSGNQINDTANAAIGGGTSHFVTLNSDRSVVLGGINATITNSTDSSALGGSDATILNSVACVAAGGFSNEFVTATNSVFTASEQCEINGASTGCVIMSASGPECTAGSQQTVIIATIGNIVTSSNAVNCAIIGTTLCSITNSTNCVIMSSNTSTLSTCVDTVVVADTGGVRSNLSQCFIAGTGTTAVSATGCASFGGDFGTAIESVSLLDATVSGTNSFAVGTGAVVNANRSIAVCSGNGGTVVSDDTILLSTNPGVGVVTELIAGCVYLDAGTGGSLHLARTPGVSSSLDLNNFANDAAALVGGIEIGQLYRNGSNMQIRVA